MKDGGPAFPCPHPSAPETGMSLRDYFAAAALQGIMANPVRWADIKHRYDTGDLSYDEASQKNAAKAYNIADAMLAERDK